MKQSSFLNQKITFETSDEEDQVQKKRKKKVVKKTTNPRANNQNSKTIFNCDYCNKNFISKSSIIAHIETCHNNLSGTSIFRTII